MNSVKCAGFWAEPKSDRGSFLLRKIQTTSLQMFSVMHARGCVAWPWKKGERDEQGSVGANMARKSG